jgi:hypothetical protein
LPASKPTAGCWQQPVSSWAWKLEALPDGATRLVTRLRNSGDWNHAAKAAFSLLLTEFGDFPMMRRILLGIKQRAQSQAQTDTDLFALVKADAQ